MLDHISLQIDPLEYCSFSRAVDHRRLPQSYAQWLQAESAGEDEIIRRGGTVRRIAIRFEEFGRYCLAMNIMPSLAVLEGFALAKAGGAEF